jgi:outer membrane protein OmpA-like peptidoglycan-associated protein
MKVNAFPKFRPAPLAALVTLSLLALSGCATKDFVQQEMGGVNGRIDTLQNLLKEASQRIDGNSVRLNYAEARLAKSEGAAALLDKRIDDNQANLAAASQRLDGIGGELAVAGERIGVNAAEIARAHQRIDVSEEQIRASRRRAEGAVAGLALAELRLTAAESALHGLSKAPTAAPEAVAPAATAQPLPLATAAPVAPAAPVAALVGDANSRLDGIAALVATANQRIAANSGAIDAVTARVGGVESGLAETRKRAEAGEQGLAVANARIDLADNRINETWQHVASQVAAIDAVEQRIAGVTAALKEDSERLTRHEADAAAGSATFKQILNGLGKQVDDVDKGMAAQGERVTQLQVAVNEHGSRIEQNEKGLAETNTQLGLAVASIKAHEERLLRGETTTSTVSATAQEALERAVAAGRLAEGKLVYETVLSEELANFVFERAKLTEASKAALTEFADKLRAENKNVFIEIQGHTDNLGPAAGNLRLGRERAETTRDFLHGSCGIPLHRMTVVSYGETRPVAENSTREGRMKNRRVVLVVLQ